jgi:hypothetical protein
MYAQKMSTVWLRVCSRESWVNRSAVRERQLSAKTDTRICLPQAKQLESTQRL